MRYVEPFTFLFRQRHLTTTLLVGSVMFFIPIVGQIVIAGWAVLVHRALMAGEQEVPALTFDDFSRLLNLGLGPFLVQLLLGIILSVVIMPLMFIPMVAMGALPAMLQTQSDGTVIAVILTVGGLSTLLFMAATYLISMFTQAVVIRAELNPDTSQAMSALSWGYMKSFFKIAKRELFMATLVLSVGGTLLVFGGMLLFYVGIFPMAVVTHAAAAHMRSQIYTAYLAKGGEPLPIAPLQGEAPPPSPDAPLPYGGQAAH